MPTLENYAFAETPHEKTVHLPSQGWRYGCHSARTGDDKPRGGTTKYIAHPWNANAGRLVVDIVLAAGRRIEDRVLLVIPKGKDAVEIFIHRGGQ